MWPWVGNYHLPLNYGVYVRHAVAHVQFLLFADYNFNGHPPVGECPTAACASWSRPTVGLEREHRRRVLSVRLCTYCIINLLVQTMGLDKGRSVWCMEERGTYGIGSHSVPVLLQGQGRPCAALSSTPAALSRAPRVMEVPIPTTHPPTPSPRLPFPHNTCHPTWKHGRDSGIYK